MIPAYPAQPMGEQIITLSGVRAYGTHGVLSSEHQVPQEFVVDAAMRVCTHKAVDEDDIACTISYADVADIIVRIIRGAHVDLIETLAYRIATAIVQLGVRWVDITVHKPHAPLEQTFADVSTHISLPGVLLEKKVHRLIVGVGSNLDSPHEHVQAAIREISEEIQVQGVSGLYRTEAQLAPGQDPQPDFVNAVLEGVSNRPLLEILHSFQRIEAQHGRVRENREYENQGEILREIRAKRFPMRWNARTLDIDIVDVEGVVSRDPELILPHPRANQRRFVLEPWHSIDPQAHLDGQPLTDLLEHVHHQRVERIVSEEHHA